MRRIFSILVLLVFGFAPVLEAIPAGALRSGWTGQVDESRLPACCRRHGQHHCMMGSEDHEIGTSVSAPGSCPRMPRGMVSAAPTLAALPGAIAVSMLCLTRRRSLQASRQAAWLNERRAWPKRGPPTKTSL